MVSGLRHADRAEEVREAKVAVRGVAAAGSPTSRESTPRMLSATVARGSSWAATAAGFITFWLLAMGARESGRATFALKVSSAHPRDLSHRNPHADQQTACSDSPSNAKRSTARYFGRWTTIKTSRCAGTGRERARRKTIA